MLHGPAASASESRMQKTTQTPISIRRSFSISTSMMGTVYAWKGMVTKCRHGKGHIKVEEVSQPLQGGKEVKGSCLSKLP